MAQADTETGKIDYKAEFRHEEGHLRDVVALLDSDIRGREERLARPTLGPDVKSADAVVANDREQLEKRRAVRPRPFFGRFDYVDDKSEDGQTIYIGNSGVNIPDVPEGFILNHNAPACSPLLQSRCRHVSNAT